MSWLFFWFQSAALPIIDIVLLSVAISARLVAFWRRSSVAGVLLVPYLGWVRFATVLKLAIWPLNVQVIEEASVFDRPVTDGLGCALRNHRSGPSRP